jgi:hypothetical protein
MKGMRGKEGNHIKLLLGISAVVIIAFMGAINYFLLQNLEYPEEGPPQQPANDSEAGDVVVEPKTTAEVIQENVEGCIYRNPSMTEEQCWDIKYHDMAIAGHNQSLCEKIKGDRIRNYCDKFFD